MTDTSRPTKWISIFMGKKHWPVSVKPRFLNTEGRTNHIKASAFLWGPIWALLSLGQRIDRRRPTHPAAGS